MSEITDPTHYELERSKAEGYYQLRRQYSTNSASLLALNITGHERDIERYSSLADDPSTAERYRWLVDRQLAWLHVARELLARTCATQSFAGTLQAPAKAVSAAASPSLSLTLRGLVSSSDERSDYHRPGPL